MFVISNANFYKNFSANPAATPSLARIVMKKEAKIATTLTIVAETVTIEIVQAQMIVVETTGILDEMIEMTEIAQAETKSMKVGTMTAKIVENVVRTVNASRPNPSTTHSHKHLFWGPYRLKSQNPKSRA